MSDLTQLLDDVNRGSTTAAQELLPLVYEELRRLAAQKMANERAGHTLQPTALVHEAWIRLGGDEAPVFQNRSHFFGAATSRTTSLSFALRLKKTSNWNLSGIRNC